MEELAAKSEIERYVQTDMMMTSKTPPVLAPTRAARLRMVCLASAAAVLFGGPVRSAPSLDESSVASLTPFVTATVSYQDNVFRKAESEPTLAGRDELITLAGGGLAFDLPISRQRLQAHVRAEHADYSSYPDLNHNPLSADASWGWAVGDWVWGAVEARYIYSLSNFEELDEIIKDMQTARDVEASAVFQLIPSIQLAVDGATGSTKKSVRSFLDRQESRFSGELRWLVGSFTYVGVRQRMVESDYLEPRINVDESLRNSDFTTTASEFVWAWEGETKSKFTGAIGATNKDFSEPESQFPDFNGLTYDAALWWRMTARVSIQGLARRMLRTRDDTSGDSVQQLVRIQPVWEVAERLSLRCGWSQEEDEFPKTQGREGVQERKDDTTRLSAGASYEPIEKLVLSLSAAHEVRDSTIPANDFIANLYSFGVELEF